MQPVVLGFDRGRHSTKAVLIVDGKRHETVMPSLVAPEPAGLDNDGDPAERIFSDGRWWLVGNRALAQAPDALYRVSGSKTAGTAAVELAVQFCSILAWAATVADVEYRPLVVVTSAPDSEWERAKGELRYALSGTFQFRIGAPVVIRRTALHGQATGTRPSAVDFLAVDVSPDRVVVARESLAPFWAHIMDLSGQFWAAERNPLMWAVGGRPGHQEAYPAKVLVIGLGFRDWNVAICDGGKRLDSRSGVRGIVEVYDALWREITGPRVGYSLKNRAELEQVLSGRHPLWTRRDPDQLEALIQDVIAKKGASILDEAAEWAGNPESYHHILACGGGALMLKKLIEQRFGSVTVAEQIDSARGLAYAGMKSLGSRGQ